jgi:N-acetylglucosaminyldiphosphoundecaprenol N-acetyl-beta-D-mannosaminyltransferase
MAATASSPPALLDERTFEQDALLEERLDRAASRPRLAPAYETTSIMGLPIHVIEQSALVDVFLEGVRTGQGGWIVTPNLDILRQFTADVASRELILSASHRVADGTPIVWASRLAGTPVPERVPGSDLVLSLPKAAARAGVSVFLLGGNPGVAEAAAGRLRREHPALQSVEFYCPPIRFEEDPAELDRIKQLLRSAQPTLVLVGLGFPKQEQLIETLRLELPSAWFVGVGISLSFLAGEQTRAPSVMQRLGLEWVHRLLHEPRRLFGRYVLQGLPFSLRLFGWALGHRLVGRP